MVDYILNRDENGMVRYLYGKDKRYPYVGKTKWESARWMLENDKTRELRMSEEYEGFPLTADGVYFFDGALAVSESEGDGGALSPAGAGTSPSADGEAKNVAPGCGPDYCEIPAAELGADGLPIPAGAEKPKRKKRTKGIVCE